MIKLNKVLTLRQRLQQRLSQTGDSEPGQAIKLRLSIGVGLLLYFCFPWREGETFSQVILSTFSLITLLYYICSLLIAIAILYNPQPSVIRRIVGIFLDLITLSVMMFFAGAESIVLYVLYPWVILGNGFRYGTKYLYIALLVAFPGFFIAITWGSYWSVIDSQSVTLSLLLVLVLIPLYSAFFITKLHAATESEKEANEAKSRFLANMSHELRTPLNGVIGIADLMGETKLDQQQYEFVDIMKESANSLLGLIENVLDISKIETGKLSLTMVEFDLHQVMNMIIKTQGPSGKAKGLDVSYYIDAQTPFLLQGDRQYLRQILVNLIGNAIKFTDEGSVQLGVYPVEIEQDKISLRFEIEDTGIGISQEDQETIFDKFSQTSSNTSNIVSGSGLGTTISKELVELMGGEIGINSHEGQGCIFWFELPFTLVSQEELQLSKEHILLLSSDEMRVEITPILNTWNVTHDFVSTSMRAFSRLMYAVEQNDPYQLMLIDQSCIIGFDPVKFSQMIKDEPVLEQLSLVLINSQERKPYSSQIRQSYISVVHDFSDKRLLFNAIHAAQNTGVQNKNVASLAEHFARQEHAKPLNILIAEDNTVNRQVLEGILKHAGHYCYLAKDGEHALDLLTEHLDDIDMLILDMNMPERSGIEVLQTMRYMEQTMRYTKNNKTVPVIMLTADATDETRAKCLSAGANLFLTKPINSRALLENIAQLSKDIHLDQKRIVQKEQKNKGDSGWFNRAKIEELSQLAEGDETFIQQLIVGFKHDGHAHIQNIQKAAKDDYLKYRESLHALKGASIELGASKLVNMCIQCEASKSMDMGSSSLLELTKQLEKYFLETVEELEKNILSKGSHSKPQG